MCRHTHITGKKRDAPANEEGEYSTKVESGAPAKEGTTAPATPEVARETAVAMCKIKQITISK